MDYLAAIQGATTQAQLDALRAQFEADLAAGRINYQAYTVIFNAYTAKGTALAGGGGDTNVPGLKESPEVVARRGSKFLEQEREPTDVFRQFLAAQPAYGQLSGLGQRAMEREYQPALQSFRAQATDPTSTFREWLQAGGQALSPQAMQAQLGKIAGYWDIPAEKRTEEQRFMIDPTRYGSNEQALAAYLQPLLARTNPMFRTAVGNVAQDIYDLFQGRTPEMPFMQEMARRGGFFGGR